jgi:hypothetical protein
MRTLRYTFILLVFWGCKNIEDTGVQKTINTANETVLNPYPSGATIPINICPLNLSYSKRATTIITVIDSCQKTIYSEKEFFRKQFKPSEKKWRKWLSEAAGGQIEICHKNVKHIWFIAADPIDRFIFYRKTFLNEDTRKMFVEERDIENFNERILIDNSKMQNTCINCHNGKNNNINYSLLHVRNYSINQSSSHVGTYLIRNGKASKIRLNKLPPPYNKLVYWDFNPTQEIIAFSTNVMGGAITYQKNGHPEDFMIDTLGMIVLYDIKEDTFITNPEFSDTAEYSFPTWDSSGKILYYCKGPKRKTEKPWEFLFDLCSVSFDSETGTFGKETIIFPFSQCGVSVTIPKIIPNTNKIIVTVHKSSGSIPLLTDGDYYILDLDKTQDSSFQIGTTPQSRRTCTVPQGKYAKITEAESINTSDHEKYHSFSSNGRWMIFSSGRLAGEMSVPHIVYVDKNGQFGKPFALPQKSPTYYTSSLWSYVYPNTSSEQAKPIDLIK